MNNKKIIAGVLIVVVGIGAYMIGLSKGKIRGAEAEKAKSQVPVTPGDEITKIPEDTTGSENGRHLVIIKKVHPEGDKLYVDVDYVVWQNCTPPADGSSCENGYKIVNNNAKLRTFLMSPYVDAELLEAPNYTVDAKAPYDYMKEKLVTNDRTDNQTLLLYSNPHEITVINNQIVKMVELYVP